MALVLKDRVKETSTSTGTGNFVLAGAVEGFQSFSTALADGDTTYYAIEDGTDWETGLGTWTESTTTLARTTVYESSNSGNAVNWGAGSKNVFITQPASRFGNMPVYANVSDLPLSGNSAGDQAYVTGNNKLYIWNGSGWYAIAAVNLTPTITTQPDSSYQFGTQGVALEVTVEATDPEGFPLTWSANTTGMTGLATLSQASNVFTFTPSTDAEDQGQSFTATFSVTDGVNTAVSNQATFTIGIDNLVEPSVGTITITAADGTAVFIAGLSELWKDVTLSVGTSSTNGIANSAFIDRSTNAHTVTPTGTPVQTAFHPYLDNWSVEFDGSADYLGLADNTDFEFDADFTIELWVYRTSATAGVYQAIVGGNGSGQNGWNIYLNQSTGQLLWFYSNFPSQTVTNVEFNKWTHIAVSRSGSNLYIFKNGVLTSTIAGYTANLVNASGIRVGYDFGANGYWQGKISNLRIVKGTALYTSNFTSPTEKLTAVTGTVLLACQSNRFIDNSSNGHTITLAGAPKISAFNPFGQESEYAVGENKGSVYAGLAADALVIPEENGTSADVTIEFWVNPALTQVYSGDAFIVGNSGSSAGTWALSFTTSTNTIGVWVNSYSGKQFVSDTAINRNAWSHVAYVNSSNTVKLYINGVEQSGSFSQTTFGRGTTVEFFRYAGFAASQAFIGHVSDFSLVRGTAKYTANFTPPTAPVGNTNASLYLPFDNAGVFDKTGNITFIEPTEAAQGAPLTDTAITKYASSSLNFGTVSEDKLYELAGTPALGTGPFTIELWVYPTNVTGTWQSVVTRGYAGGGSFRLYKTATTPGFSWYQGTSQIINSGSVLSNNTWYHVAVCRDASNDVRMFVDGVQVGATPNSTYNYSMTDGSNPVNVGAGGRGEASTYPFAGNIEGLQILVGTAKYTSNFTVPDKKQGIAYQAES